MFRRFTILLLVLLLGLFPALQPFANDDSSKTHALLSEQIIDASQLGNYSKSSNRNHVITLITGDVVTVTDIGNDKSVITVDPANKVNNGFQIMTLGEDTYVIPNEAMTHVASDLLDKKLFNITQLIADGYDDENEATLPVIVQYHETNARFESALPAALAGSKRTNVLTSIDSVAVATNKKHAEEFWEDVTEIAAESSEMIGGIKKIWLDGRVQMHLGQSVPQIGAPEVWDLGYDGSGVKVAVLDTGIDVTHPDLKAQFVEIESFVPDEDDKDYSGHGTHVASTILGTGDGSSGFHKGVAPGAELYSGKVLDSTGYGQESWIIDAMEWAASKADIVNMSLGNSTPSDGTDPMSQSVNRLSETTGTLFVIAAGNSGAEGIGSPGAADLALTVGNVDKQDNLAFSSTRGPRYKNDGLKPDLVAPGTDIMAARSSDSRQGEGLYIALSGTSMASPHVAGAAAILKQIHPEWSGQQLKAALMSSTKKIDNIKPYQGGSGRLDIQAAALQTIISSGSIDFGFFQWPHVNIEAVSRTVTYTNVGSDEVIIDLEATFTDKNGVPAPEGVFSLSTTQLTIPANGTADVIATFNPELANVNERYQGHLVAMLNDEIVATSAMAVGVEGERHTLTLNATDTQGEDAQMIVTLVGADFQPRFFSLNGQTELRLEPGTYSVMGMMDVDNHTDHAGVAVLGNPEIVLDTDKVVHLDARNVNEIAVDIADKHVSEFRKLELFRSFGEGKELEFTYIIPDTKDKMYAQTIAPITDGIFEFNTRWRLAKPKLSIRLGEADVVNKPLPGGSLLDGQYELPIVYAGHGKISDYTNIDASDKAVVIERSDELTGSERAEAAIEAGAKLLMIVNDHDSKFSEWVGSPNYMENSPIAVTGISGIEGAKLIEAAKAEAGRIHVEGTAVSPYIYDLIDNHRNEIPENVSYAPTKEELVRIDANYYSDVAVDGAEFRWDIPSYRDNGIGFRVDLNMPLSRTEWVSASEGNLWYHEAQMFDEWGSEIWEIRQPMASYVRGEQLKENWFSPIVRPYIGEGYWVPERFENDLQFNIPIAGDGGVGNAGWSIGMPDDSLKLYQGDELLATDSGQVLIYNDAEEGLTEYRLVSDASRDPERWNTSIRTHTEWTVWTEKQDEFHTFLPMISLDFFVDTDMQGIAIGGDKIQFGMRASQISYASGNGTIEGASLDVSFDEGETWKEVELVQNGDGWLAEISNDAEAGTYVSIRASAWDDLGNKIEQEIIKAFGVSSDTVTLATDQADYALKTGATRQMTVTEVSTPKGEGKPTLKDVTTGATYVVEDEKVATVEAGLITAKAKGSTKVTVSYGGKQVVANVTVTDPLNPGPIIPGPVDPDPEKPVVPEFTDITNTFAKEEITKLAAKGIIQGKTETTFAPNAQISRAEFTVLLARALNLPMKEYEGKFKDVHTSKKWAYAGIEAAANAGIVNGTLDGKFNPDAPIKREEIAAMVVRAIEYKDKTKLADLDTPENFTDHGSIGAYAIDAVYKATALGVIKGNEGQFKPKHNATRAEAAVMLYRALDTLTLLD